MKTVPARYTSDTVFDTFPWPQRPDRAAVKAVARASVELRALRQEPLQRHQFCLRDLYRTLDEPGENPLRVAHARLDQAVRAAYGFPNDVDPLAALLELNQALAARERAKEPVTPPGFPLASAERTAFTLADCIEVRNSET